MYFLVLGYQWFANHPSKPNMLQFLTGCFWWFGHPALLDEWVATKGHPFIKTQKGHRPPTVDGSEILHHFSIGFHISQMGADFWVASTVWWWLLSSFWFLETTGEGVCFVEMQICFRWWKMVVQHILNSFSLMKENQHLWWDSGELVLSWLKGWLSSKQSMLPCMENMLPSKTYWCISSYKFVGIIPTHPAV